MHIITRMIIGGAQENTLWNCLDLMRLFDDEVVLVTGPSDGPEGELLKQGRAAELPIIVEPRLARAIHPIRDYSCLQALRKHIRNWCPDVVHTHSAKGGFLGRLAAWKEGVPAIVHTVHGAPFHAYQSWLARRVFIGCERYAAKHCHAMISVADAMTDLMVNAKVAKREKFTTIYSGMEVEPFLEARQHRQTARQHFGFRDDDIVIGKVARLFRLKGHDDLLDAAQEVVKSCPRVKFLWVGDGNLRESLESRTRDLGLTNHIVFAGLVSPEEVPFMMSAMDVLVHTSLREGLARTLPQALLTGIPVVSFDIDGAREVCIDGETGRLLAPRDISGLSRALLDLAESPETCQRMGRMGQQLCLWKFPHDQMTKAIRELYRCIVEELPEYSF